MVPVNLCALLLAPCLLRQAHAAKEQGHGLHFPSTLPLLMPAEKGCGVAYLVASAVNSWAVQISGRLLVIHGPGQPQVCVRFADSRGAMY